MKNFKKVLSLALALLMVVGCMVVAPVETKAADTYTKVTDVSTITDGGNFVIIAASTDADTSTTKYYAMNSIDGGWLTATEVTASSTTIPTITITKSGSNVTLATASGDAICGSYSTEKAYKNKLLADTTNCTADWSVSESGTDTFSFLLTGNTDTADTENTNRYIAFAESSVKYRNYLNSTITGYTGYVKEYMVYKYEGQVIDPNITLEADATPAEIVDAAYKAKEDGVKLNGEWTLEGVVTAVNDPYTGEGDYENVTVTMLVTGADDKKPIMCYQMSGEGFDKVAVGYTIKVKGTLTYYGDDVEFAKGCQLLSYKEGEVKPTLEGNPTSAEIVNKAYELAATGEVMIGEYTVTGVIVSVDDPYEGEGDYKNATVTISVEGTDKTIQCYRIVGTDIGNLTKGGTVTVKGTIDYYKGVPQLAAGSTLVSYVAAEGGITDTSDNFLPVFVVLFAGCALVAVGFVGRRKMA